MSSNAPARALRRRSSLAFLAVIGVSMLLSPPVWSRGRLSCDVAQGDAIAAPMPVAAFLDRLAAERSPLVPQDDVASR